MGQGAPIQEMSGGDRVTTLEAAVSGGGVGCEKRGVQERGGMERLGKDRPARRGAAVVRGEERVGEHRHVR